jgi:hypothetical protein
MSDVDPEVVAAAVDLRWEPNAPEAALLSLDDSRVVLALRPHFDDVDQRTVVLRFDGAVQSTMTGDNDEGLSRHRLYDRGLDRLLWLGTVENTDWSWEQKAWRTQPLRHFIAALKESVVEVMAESVIVLRSDQAPAAAVVEALS